MIEKQRASLSNSGARYLASGWRDPPAQSGAHVGSLAGMSTATRVSPLPALSVWWEDASTDPCHGTGAKEMEGDGHTLEDEKEIEDDTRVESQKKRVWGRPWYPLASRRRPP